jgi:hypothetical protein
MAYVYLHRQKDNNEPFYVGVGGLLSFDNYQRANANNWKGLASRSKFWKSIVSKFGFTVEIVLDNCTKQEAFSEEIRLIKLYGRQDIETGILVNHTDGGDGRVNSSTEIKSNCGKKNIGRKLSEDHIQKISNANKGKVSSDEKRLKISLFQKGKSKNYRSSTAKYVIDTETSVVYDSCVKAALAIGLNSATLRAMLNGKNKNRTNLKYI